MMHLQRFHPPLTRLLRASCVVGAAMIGACLCACTEQRLPAVSPVQAAEETAAEVERDADPWAPPAAEPSGAGDDAEEQAPPAREAPTQSPEEPAPAEPSSGGDA